MSAQHVPGTATRAIEFDFASADGLRIRCARWESGRSPRAVVQIAHGMGEHLGRYAETIDALVRAGLVVYGNDHRGHGRTAPSREAFGDFGAGGFELLVQDMSRLGEIARSEHCDAPFILFGHSMGSFAAQRYAIEHSREMDALILSGSGALDALARVAAAATSGSNILNAAFEPARTPFDWLSRDEAVVDAFASDPLCFAALGPDAFASFLGTAPQLSDPSALRGIRLDLPVYLFSGSDDPVGQELKGLRTLIDRYRSAGLRHIACDFYQGGRHEMLNEINRVEVRANLLSWIEGIVGRTTSPELPSVA